jgi:hypothetical protein
MKPEAIFGFDAGKVWGVLNATKKALSITEIMKLGKLKRDDVLAGLGWLGREGKIEVLKQKDGMLFRLL